MIKDYVWFSLSVVSQLILLYTWLRALKIIKFWKSECERYKAIVDCFLNEDDVERKKRYTQSIIYPDSYLFAKLNDKNWPIIKNPMIKEQEVVK